MKYSHMISEMLGEIYQSQTLYQSISQSLEINPQRIWILYDIVINYDRMESEEMKRKVYRYGSMISEEDLLARQIFLCLVRLAEKKDG